MKKVNVVLLSIVAVIMSVCVTSCSGDDDASASSSKSEVWVSDITTSSATVYFTFDGDANAYYELYVNEKLADNFDMGRWYSSIVALDPDFATGDTIKFDALSIAPGSTFDVKLMKGETSLSTASFTSESVADDVPEVAGISISVDNSYYFTVTVNFTRFENSGHNYNLYLNGLYTGNRATQAGSTKIVVQDMEIVAGDILTLTATTNITSASNADEVLGIGTYTVTADDLQ